MSVPRTARAQPLSPLGAWAVRRGAEGMTANRRTEVARKAAKSDGKREIWNNLRNIFLVFGRGICIFEPQSGELPVPHRTMIETLDAIGESLLDELDDIARAADARYRSYKTDDLIEHDVRAQAACTYCHMVADADRKFDGRPDVRPLDIRGLKVWLFKKANVVIRLKKMDEDGRSRNYPTRQAKAFDAQKDLPGLPLPAREADSRLLFGPNWPLCKIADRTPRWP